MLLWRKPEPRVTADESVVVLHVTDLLEFTEDEEQEGHKKSLMIRDLERQAVREGQSFMVSDGKMRKRLEDRDFTSAVVKGP